MRDEIVRDTDRIGDEVHIREVFRGQLGKFRPTYADRRDHVLLLGSWTKGGLERPIPIKTPEQRAVLDEAHKLAGSGALIPANKRYIEQLRMYEGQCKAAGLSRMHGLRHRYAQQRYEALTGWKASAGGGPPKRTLDELQREKDAAARQVISRVLGHERRAITQCLPGQVEGCPPRAHRTAEG